MECHWVYQLHSREDLMPEENWPTIMNSLVFIVDMDLEFCLESTYEDAYQRTGIF